jgi:hypothetical protein
MKRILTLLIMMMTLISTSSAYAQMDTTARGIAIQASKSADRATELLGHESVSALYNLKKRLQDNNSHINVLIVGDSTSTYAGGSTGKGWSTQFVEALVAKYPKFTWIYRYGYNSQTGGYGNTTTLNTGTNGYNVIVYNVGVGGTIPAHALGSPNVGQGYYPPGMGINQFDLIIYDYGFNGTSLAQMLTTLDTIQSWHMQAGLLIMEQWPIYGNNNGTTNALAARRLAALKNASIIPAEGLFMAASKPASWYTGTPVVGEVHPSVLGHQMITKMMLSMFDSATEMRFPRAPTINVPTPNILSNGKFDAFSAGTLTGWTTVNATLAENTTTFITGTRSIDLTVGTNSDSYMQQQITDPGVLRRLSRQTLTLSAPIILPTTQTATNCILSVWYNGTELASSDRPFSSISGVYDQSGGGYVLRAAQVQMPEITNYTLPLSIRFYGMEGVDASRSGVGKVCNIGNIKLDIGSFPYAQ